MRISYWSSDVCSSDLKPNDRLIKAFRDLIDAYMAKEVLPHVADAWVDYDKTKVGYEIPINRHFYVYKPPRPLPEIEADIRQLEGDRKSVVEGKSVSVRVVLGGRRIIKKKKNMR